MWKLQNKLDHVWRISFCNKCDMGFWTTRNDFALKVQIVVHQLYWGYDATYESPHQVKHWFWKGQFSYTQSSFHELTVVWVVTFSQHGVCLSVSISKRLACFLFFLKVEKRMLVSWSLETYIWNQYIIWDCFNCKKSICLC